MIFAVVLAAGAAATKRRRQRGAGTGCMSSALTGCFLAASPDEPLHAAAQALAAFGVAVEDATRGADGPGTFHARLYDALYRLEPDTLDARVRIDEQ